jgi:hypothetical protein
MIQRSNQPTSYLRRKGLPLKVHHTGRTQMSRTVNGTFLHFLPPSRHPTQRRVASRTGLDSTHCKWSLSPPLTESRRSTPRRIPKFRSPPSFSGLHFRSLTQSPEHFRSVVSPAHLTWDLDFAWKAHPSRVEFSSFDHIILKTTDVRNLSSCRGLRAAMNPSQ